ncbi:MAG: EamA family transporter [Planctomycetaceae bacterium]
MVFLALNIVFASSFMLCIKWVQLRQREDLLTVGVINYIVAAALTVPEFLTSGTSETSVNAILTGGILGICYFVAFFFVMSAVKTAGASSTSVIGALSILLPIGCGVFIWQETPHPLQAGGVVLAVLALSLVGSNRTDTPHTADPGPTVRSRNRKAPVILTVFFLLAGISRLTQETFKHESHAEQRPTFLFTAFAVAAIPSIVILTVRRRRPTLREFGFGILLGTANILQTHFILKSLHHFPGFIVFPVSSAGGVLLTVTVATVFLGERLNRRTCWGIGIAVVSLVMLNWLPGNTL